MNQDQNRDQLLLLGDDVLKASQRGIPQFVQGTYCCLLEDLCVHLLSNHRVSGSVLGPQNTEGEYRHSNKSVSFGSSDSSEGGKKINQYMSDGNGYEEKLSKL